MNEKKYILFFIFIIMGVFLTIGFAEAAEPVTLRIGHAFSPKHPYSTACEMLAKEVSEKTKGQVVFKHYPAGQLGTETEITDQMIKGTIDLQPTGPTALGTYFDTMNSLQVYYLVDSPQQLLKIMRGPIGQKLFEECRQKVGVRILDTLYYGLRHILTAKKPIQKPEDLSGMKIRSMTVPFLKMSLESMGPTGVPVPMPELYLAVQTGVVDGLENTPVSIMLEKYFEVAKFYSLTGHSVHPSLWNFSEKSWQTKVPNDAKPIIMEAIKKVTEWEIEEMINQEKEALDFLEKKGIKIIQVDREPFKKSVQKIYPKLEERFGPIFKEIAQAAAEMK